MFHVFFQFHGITWILTVRKFAILVQNQCLGEVISSETKWLSLKAFTHWQRGRCEPSQQALHRSCRRWKLRSRCPQISQRIRRKTRFSNLAFVRAKRSRRRGSIQSSTRSCLILQESLSRWGWTISVDPKKNLIVQRVTWQKHVFAIPFELCIGKLNKWPGKFFLCLFNGRFRLLNKQALWTILKCLFFLLCIFKTELWGQDYENSRCRNRCCWTPCSRAPLKRNWAEDRRWNKNIGRRRRPSMPPIPPSPNL